MNFLEWVDNSQRLTSNGKRYYRYGWRLLSYSKLAGMRLDQISQDVAESVVFRRPLLDRKKKNKEGRYELKKGAKEMIYLHRPLHEPSAADTKVMQGKAVQWKVLPGEAQDHVGLCSRTRPDDRRSGRG